MVQLRPLAAQGLSGARFVKEEHRLESVEGESRRGRAWFRASWHPKATQQGGVDAPPTAGGTGPVRDPLYKKGAQARKRRGREEERESGGCREIRNLTSAGPYAKVEPQGGDAVEEAPGTTPVAGASYL